MPLAISDDHRALAEVVRDVAVAEGLRALTRRALDALPEPESPPNVYRERRVARPTSSGSAAPDEVGSAEPSGAG
ncbi:hypothetical protein, partial [Candidatus Frankia nodulisporulans]|uniref:hypothetical protein n=1 Tax=Candidatus Frankia nodulisporulans TaxID=2060052 RepID=UPI0013D31F0B